jgi:hypothetical protein
MIGEPRGRIEYNEHGAGPTIVLDPEFGLWARGSIVTNVTGFHEIEIHL